MNAPYVRTDARNRRHCSPAATQFLRPAFRAVAGLLALPFAVTLSAQTPPATNPAPPAGNRFLLVFQTSSAMRKRTELVQQTAGELIFSGLNGVMGRGDTFGLWTFNETLRAGYFPLQRWSPEAKFTLARTVTDFLKQQRYEKDAQLEPVLAALAPVIRESAAITVLIFSDGEQEINGTPFDREINEVYRQHRRELRAARGAFVTVLYARGGKIVNYSMNSTGGPILIPTTPAPGFAEPGPSVADAPEKAPAPAAAVATTNAASAPPIKTVAPLIVEKGVVKVASWTNTASPGVTTAPEPPAAPTETLKAAEPLPSAPETESELEPQTSLVAAPGAQPESASPAETAAKKAAKTESPSLTAAALREPVVVTPPSKVDSVPMPAEPAPASSVSILVVKADSAAPLPATGARDAKAEAVRPLVLSPQEAPGHAPFPEAPPAQVATVTSAETPFTTKWLLIACSACLILAVASIFVLIRRARPAPHASLITQSFERDKK